ncbi:MAG: hypothetical protein AAGI90_01430 [Chlamydiota bacterium]
MNRYILSLLLIGSQIQAVEINSLGTAATASKAQSSYTQNWVFAGGALALAFLGILLVTVDQGKKVSSGNDN